MVAVATIDPSKSPLLGECIVYLGVFNYFFAVDESTPVVSRIGTIVGYLDLRITPYVAVAQRGGQGKSILMHCFHVSHLSYEPFCLQAEEEFVPYERDDMDSEEDQLHDHMDRTLQYRVQLRGLRALASQRFPRVSLRYTFFRETSTQTPRLRVDERGDSDPLDLEFRHVVDVSDAFVKYVTGSNLAIEVLGHFE